MRVVIIGGVAGGAGAATRLRRLDESAEIIILERGDMISYANCGLPYYLGGVIAEKGALSVATPEFLKIRFNIDVRVRSEAVKIDREAHTVTIKDERGEYLLSYDKLILATGARANTFGLAFFIYFLFRNQALTYLVMLWALLTCYSRAYLGVHYPGDLLVGALLGLAGAALCYGLFRWVCKYRRPARLLDVWVPVAVGCLTVAGLLVYSFF